MSPFFETHDLTKIGQSLLYTGSPTQNTTCIITWKYGPCSDPRARPNPIGEFEPNLGDAQFYFFLFSVLLNFLFQKCRNPNPWSDPNGESEPKPGLLRPFYLSYQKHFINLFSCGSGFSFEQAHNHLQIQSNSVRP